jgi:hypothetical protein
MFEEEDWAVTLSQNAASKGTNIGGSQTQTPMTAVAIPV